MYLETIDLMKSHVSAEMDCCRRSRSSSGSSFSKTQACIPAINWVGVMQLSWSAMTPAIRLRSVSLDSIGSFSRNDDPLRPGVGVIHCEECKPVCLLQAKEKRERGTRRVREETTLIG